MILVLAKKWDNSGLYDLPREGRGEGAGDRNLGRAIARSLTRHSESAVGRQASGICEFVRNDFIMSGIKTVSKVDRRKLCYVISPSRIRGGASQELKGVGNEAFLFIACCRCDFGRLCRDRVVRFDGVGLLLRRGLFGIPIKILKSKYAVARPLTRHGSRWGSHCCQLSSKARLRAFQYACSHNRKE